MLDRLIVRAKTEVKRVDDNWVTMKKRVECFREKNGDVETHLKEHGIFEIVSDNI
jgi:hypothetical protein